jgi:acetylornithine/N-succinyldiaminopimelate aminotransferase
VRVKRIAANTRRTCVLGPGRGHLGAGLVVGLRTKRPAKENQAELHECGIPAGTASDPQVLRLLPPFILEEQHVDMLRDALRELPA